MEAEICECGHDLLEHNYTPSGCGIPRCLHGLDEETMRRNCDCNEYYPQGE